MQNPIRPVGPPNWAELTSKIRHNNPSGLKELHRIFSPGMRFLFRRYLGTQDLDALMRDTFLIVAHGIQAGELGEPERLPEYVRTIISRQVAAQMDDMAHERRHRFDALCTMRTNEPGPEQDPTRRENWETALNILKRLRARDREILVRFYLWEEPPETICREMGLTETEFLARKSRAKARFGSLGTPVIPTSRARAHGLDT
jgi:DNA-directed RNA polymerase specialized sigma24 family protein